MFGLKQTRIEVVYTENISVLVDVENKGADGEIHKTSQYVPGIREIYDVIYKCKRCGNETRKRRKREYPKI